ncbi:MAG: hypothetical protein IJ268_14290 [Proteobacteria bacterium]|nr:hypothetical protein [Pseudomonadota bacterium]
MFLLPTAASAQDGCSTIRSNPEWTSGLKQLVDTMQANDWQTAKQQAKSLSLICPNAPVLNYLRGKIAEQLDEKQDALYYFQNASEGTYTFAVDPETAKKIWYARYESENPERTAEALELKNKTASAREAEIAELKKVNASAEFKLNDLNAQNAKPLMWTGVGIGAGGLALTGTGVALLFISHPSKIERDNEKGYNVKNDPLYSVGWGVTGLGAGLLVTGAVLAGIYGYKYQKFKTQNNLSFGISPTSISFSMTF